MPQRNLRHFSVDKVVPPAVFCECQINQALLLYLIRIFCGHLLHSVHTERIDQGTGLPLSVNHTFSSISLNKYDDYNIRKTDFARLSVNIR